ncbi:YopX protein [compost metagenome]
MREIKFRAKCKETGEWCYGNLISEINGSEIKTFIHNRVSPVSFTENSLTSGLVLFEVDPETVGQYTGVADKNGRSIFDGQAVLITGEQELDFGLFFQWNDKAVVRWSDDECGYYLDVINKREVSLCQDGYFTVDTFPLRKWDEEEWSIEYEVMDNPDLLGEVRE